MTSDAQALGAIVLTIVGIGAFVGLNFACYYVPTRLMIAKAGLPPMALRYYLQGFAGMILAGLIVAIVLQLIFFGKGWIS